MSKFETMGSMLGEAPGVGVERGEALHRGLRLCHERGAVDADGTAACDHELAANQHLVDGAAVLCEHDLVALAGTLRSTTESLFRLRRTQLLGIANPSGN